MTELQRYALEHAWARAYERLTEHNTRTTPDHRWVMGLSVNK